jgi:excinuclease ABC subunit C
VPEQHPETDEVTTEQPEAGLGAAVDEKLAALPARAGVYLLKDRRGKVVYVGKAKNLRARVRTYFRGGDERSQVRFLMAKVFDLETLVAASEKEALILENNLIKQYKPRYNIRLKDDKSYVSVKVTVTDPWPRILVTRKIVKDGSKYFGPYHSAYSVRETLDTIRKIIPLRTCSNGVFRNRSRPCLEYQIKRCLGPCCLAVDPEAYKEHLRQATMLLEGKSRELVRQLKSSMETSAAELRFEEAARIRDQIRAIEKTQEKQQVVAHWGGDQDVFGLYREGGFVEAQVLFVRNGKLTGNQAYSFEDYELGDEELLQSLLTQFYQGDRYVPDEILVPADVEDREVRMEYLSERKDARVQIFRPQRGDKASLLRMAQENAAHSFRERRDTGKQRERMIEELQRKLHLRNAPKRIECFDISNIQGSLAVGSMVTFDEGEPDKNRYRRFRIRTVPGADDFAMMYEVLKRRFTRAKAEGSYPDLLVVDGGKGQLNVAVEVLRELDINEVDAVGLAKARVERDPQSPDLKQSDERVFLPGRMNPVVLRSNSSALFLMQRVRDEAHRFAITYHRELRRKERLRSILDAIPGVGPLRRRRLLRHFGSVQRVRQASAEELAQVRGVSLALAQQIKDQLPPLPKPPEPPADNPASTS